MQRDKQKKAEELKAKGGDVGGVDTDEDEYESSSSDSDLSEGKLDMNALLMKNIKDIDSIVNTPRSRYVSTDAEMPIFGYEEGGRIEMPWYTEEKKI